ncbi:carbohydrate kinase family protein, partial [Patescibacteria group bacterium]|nr:carbohydrate kinase family protein [Patescibacteria group bacterium]
MYDIITFGGATLDIFMKDKEFEISEVTNDLKKLCLAFGDKIIVDDVHFTNGGGGMNTATSFAQLGFKTSFLGAIGDDEIGDSIKAKLKKKNISSDLLQTIKDAKSGLSVAMHAGERERTLLLFRGANDDLRPEQVPWEKLSQTKWIYLSHLSGKSDASLSRLADFIEQNDIKLAWNPGSTQLKKGLPHLEKLLKKTTILNINKEEAELLSGITVARNKNLSQDEIDDMTPVFEKLAKVGPKIIVITDGKKGAAVF